MFEPWRLEERFSSRVRKPWMLNSWFIIYPSRDFPSSIHMVLDNEEELVVAVVLNPSRMVRSIARQLESWWMKIQMLSLYPF